MATATKTAKTTDPTAAQFGAYRAQYDYFNRVLFAGKRRQRSSSRARRVRATPGASRLCRSCAATATSRWSRASFRRRRRNARSLRRVRRDATH